jgi:hypothetical protein
MRTFFLPVQAVAVLVLFAAVADAADRPETPASMISPRLQKSAADFPRICPSSPSIMFAGR